jgi:hypothetical protein
MFEKLGKSIDEFVSTVGGDLRMTRIDPKSDPISVDYPAESDAKLRLELGFGKMTLSAGGSKIVDGTATYNVAEWEPQVETAGNTVTVKQGKGFHVLGGWGEARNEWDFALGTAHPFELSVSKGAGESNLTLGGVPLTAVTLEAGAGQSKVNFDKPNPVSAKFVAFKMGAGQSKLAGLLNTNAQYINVECGAGEISLNFNGEVLTRDMNVKVNVGTGQVKIKIQKGVAVRASVTKGLGDVKVRGSLEGRGNHTYETPNLGLAEHKITFEVVAGVGSVILVSDDGLEDIFA